MRGAERLYLERKIGIGSTLQFRIASMMPLLIVMLITAVLVFSLTFICSMTDAIEKAIEYLGSGDVYALEYADPDEYPEIKEEFYIAKGEGIIYSADSECLVCLKGAEPGYFTPERRAVLHLDDGYEHKEKGILISAAISERLSLSPGDKLTLLYYEEGKNRTRPMLLTVTGIFDSGYSQLDRYLAFVDSSCLAGNSGGYEIMVDGDAASFARKLQMDGIQAQSYDQMYSQLYGNVRNSMVILYAVFCIVAVLAAFFSSDAAHAYITRDRRDIAAMMLLGLPEGRIRRIYLKITLFFVFLSSSIGALAGILLSMAIPGLMGFIAEEDASLLQYYIKSFDVRIPAGSVIMIIVLMLAVSAASVYVSLRMLKMKDLGALVKGQ